MRYFTFARVGLLAALGLTLVPALQALGSSYSPIFAPCEPQSEFIVEPGDPSTLNSPTWSTSANSSNDPLRGLNLDFCAKWNPDFPYNGHRCCQKIVYRRRRRRGGRCAPERHKKSYCSDVTAEQVSYAAAVRDNKVDVLAQITAELGRKAAQAQCSPNNGFLVHGRPLVPTLQNKVRLRAPDRCTEYGTDSMIGMIDWLGHQVAKRYPGKEYEGTKLVVGDIASPRGGCTGHASHRSGQDVDLGFLTAEADEDSPSNFHRDYDAKTNWWFLKQVLKNPFACVKVIFLDRKLIRKLDRAAQGDEDWQLYRRFIRHMPAHKNHHHVRIGAFPGQPGCVADAKPELEEEETASDVEGAEVPELEE